MDLRDEPTWVVVELTRAGDVKAAEGKLDALLRRDLGVGPDFPIFIPYALFSKGGRKVSIRLVDGYVFLGSDLPEVRYFRLESLPFVESILSTRSGRGMRVLQTIPNSHVEELRERLRRELSVSIEEGSNVRVVRGNYANLTGRVIDVMGDRISVGIGLRSREIVTVLPRTYAELLDTSESVEVVIPEPDRSGEYASYEDLADEELEA